MARGRPDLQGDLSKSYALAVNQWLGGETDHGGLSERDNGARLLRELKMAGEEVGMHVGFDHPLYAQSLGGRLGEVDTDVTARVDDHRPTAGLVADQVGGVRKAPQIVLGEDHDLALCLGKPGWRTMRMAGSPMVLLCSRPA